MDKKQFIEYDNELRATGNLSDLKLYTIVESYCVEKGVSPKVIDTYLPTLMSTLYGGICIASAIEYYESKFNVCKLMIENSNGKLEVVNVY